MKVNTSHLTPNVLFSFHWVRFNVIKIVTTILSTIIDCILHASSAIKYVYSPI